jgi:Domain of Unknown Function (DUF1259)
VKEVMIVNRRRNNKNFDFFGGMDFGHDADVSPSMFRSRRNKERVENICDKLADIIGGVVIQSSPVCVVMRLRNIRASILGRQTRSPLALPFMLSFENNGLNLGESVLLQKEVNPMINALRKRGIIVTAFHNHWLFEDPRLMYLHWENVGMSPMEFAKASFAAAKEAGLF